MKIKLSNLSGQHRFTLPTSLTLIAAIVTGCVEDGDLVTRAIPYADNVAMDFYCADEGVAESTCTLDNPSNPFANMTLLGDNKWAQFESLPNTSSANLFYFWASALAQEPNGENQFYAADALHGLYHRLVEEGNSGNQVDGIRDQAKRAYRAGLDQFYDDVTYIPVAAALDYVPDTDFIYSDWSSGSSFDGNYTADPAISPVWSTVPGNGWNVARGAVAYIVKDKASFDEDVSHLEFKLKGLDSFAVKLLSNAGENELAFQLSDVGVTLDGLEGWSQVSIPLAQFGEDIAASITQFAIMTDAGHTDRFLITDVALTGQGELADDKNGDGKLYFYQSNPEITYEPLDLRNWVAGGVVNPRITNLFGDQASAEKALASWGYQFDTDAGLVSRIK